MTIWWPLHNLQSKCNGMQLHFIAIYAHNNWFFSLPLTDFNCHKYYVHSKGGVSGFFSIPFFTIYTFCIVNTHKALAIKLSIAARLLSYHNFSCFFSSKLFEFTSESYVAYTNFADYLIIFFSTPSFVVFQLWKKGRKNNKRVNLANLASHHGRIFFLHS